MYKEKQFVVNLNPNENQKVGFLNWGLLYNPFPKCAVGYGGSASSPWSREMDAVRHLEAGVSLKHTRWLLKLFLTAEASQIILRGIKPGQRWHIIVRGAADGGVILRKPITKEEQQKLAGQHRQRSLKEILDTFLGEGE